MGFLFQGFEWAAENTGVALPERPPLVTLESFFAALIKEGTSSSPLT